MRKRAGDLDAEQRNHVDGPLKAWHRHRAPDPVMAKVELGRLEIGSVPQNGQKVDGDVAVDRDAVVDGDVVGHCDRLDSGTASGRVSIGVAIDWTAQS